MRGFVVGAVALVILIAVGILGLPGALMSPAAGAVRDASDPHAPRARAVLKDADGRTVGEARLQEGPNGVLIRLDLENVPPGERGLHVHETGRCDAPDFTSAGGHFSPDGSEHGFLNEEGPHAGDLPNIYIPEDGRLSVELFAGGVTLRPGPRSLLVDAGTALMIHEDADDHLSDPTGEAGGRVACGVVTRR